ncbi:YtxH domain-containing protein [Nonlabens ponticola]|uniref:YtxH domain-containing protein n=1 Tax=Nonlabens ponticola TaxID=2496866 RepID=A0A3S9MVJ2_9FLAO|nr:YtxH domain-containing protein [Nonlabens ponticola]AZQ43147.1 YtxH domain-containing protein [Nonlabens ponticola]
MAKTGNTLVALVAGAAIGAVAGLLYAPESGEKTRKNLSKKAKKTQADIEASTRKTYNDLTTKATEFKGTVSERIDSALSTASYAADDAIVALENKLEQLRAKNAKLQQPSSVNGAVKTAAAKTKA